MRKFGLLLVVIPIILGAQITVAADESFVISEIRITGLQRVSEGTVFNVLPVQVGDQLDSAGSAALIGKVFATGFFRDVRVQRDGDVLVLEVVEQASILGIEFKGNRKANESKMREIIDALELAPGRIFNQATLDRALRELRSFYFSKGHYSVDIRAEVQEEPDNQVSLIMDIDEDEVARIKKISIVGNDFYKDRKLLKRLNLKDDSAFLSSLRSSNLYSREKLEAGLEVLESFYQDQGFLQFEIVSTQVSITPDKRDIYITISINEGLRYVYADATLTGETVFAKEELLSLITLRPDEVFSRLKLSQSREALVEKLTDYGYVNVEVEARENLDEVTGSVSYEFIVDPGPRFYVRRIRIEGNTATRDEVIRRELRQYEGGWYSSARVRRSRVRLQRLGFFGNIDIRTEEVPGTNDQVDLIVTVAEQSTGSITFTLGYSDNDGLLFEVGVSQKNFAGTGNELSFNVKQSQTTETYTLLYRDPYHTLAGVSRTVFIGQQRVDAAATTSTADFVQNTRNAGVLYEIPFSEFSNWRIGASYAPVELRPAGANTPQSFEDFIMLNPGFNQQYVFDAGYVYDSRDSFRYPTEGRRDSIEVEAALPESDLQYYKLSLRSAAYRKLNDDLVLRGYADLGYGDGYGNTSDLPFYQNYYAGGAGTVRGYESRTLGPQGCTGPEVDGVCPSGVTTTPTGGSVRVLVGTELYFPVPGSKSKGNQRLGLFLDSGQVYARPSDFDASDIRFSVGGAFYWFSPLGPVSISYTEPLNKKPGDDTKSFDFTLGVNFR